MQCVLGWCFANIGIIISIIALGATIWFSYLQQIHNKNSVRPICEIILNDCEKLLDVKIKNMGTGPMVIKKLTCTDEHGTSSALIEKMPPNYRKVELFCERN